MIFKTFDSKIDKWTSKIGVFGKSFNDLGTAVNEAFNSVINNLDNFEEDVGFWESLKNNLFSKQTDKNWIKNSFGDIISKENIDSYIAELDLDSAKKKLQGIFAWQESVKNNNKSWQDYFDSLDNNENYITALIKNTDDLSRLTGEDLVKANHQARASILAHNEALKAQTLSAKAGKVALQSLATVGNMLLMWGITKVVSTAAEKITDLANASEIAEKKASGFASSVNSSVANISSNASVLSRLNAEYQRLSKGVNALGQNVSLSGDEYNQYKEIVSQISDIMPDLTTYFDAQGNKIGFVKGQLQSLNKEYQNCIRQQAKEFLVNGDEDGNTFEDTLVNFKSNNSKNTLENLIAGFHQFFGNYDLNDLPVNDVLSVFNELKNKTAEEMADYLSDIEIANTGVILNNEGRAKAAIQSVLGSPEEIRNSAGEEFNILQQEISAYIQELQSDIDSDMNKITAGLIQSAYANDSFWALSREQTRDGITTFLSSITADVWSQSGIENAHEANVFVSEIIDAFSKNTDGITDAWNNLFTLDTSEISISEYIASVQKYMDTICNTLGITDGDARKQFMISLGFNIDVDQGMVEGLKKKLTGSEEHATSGYSSAISGNMQQVSKQDITDWIDSLTASELVLANSDAFMKELAEQEKSLEGASLSAEDYENALQRVKNGMEQVESIGSPSFFEIFESAEFSEISEKLLEIAQAGELSDQTLTSTDDYMKLLDLTGTSAEEAATRIRNMLTEQEKLSAASQGINSLKSSYEEFMDIGFVTVQTLESLPDVFKELPEYDIFRRIAGNPENGTEEIQNAFNDIATAYLLSQNTLSELVNASEGTIQTYIANLRQMGITNAEDIVNQTVAVLNTENELIRAAEEEYYGMYLDYIMGKGNLDTAYLLSTASKNGQLAAMLGFAYQQDFNNWCGLLSQKAIAYNDFITALGGSYDPSKDIASNIAANGKNVSALTISEGYEKAGEYAKAQNAAEQASKTLQLNLSPIKTNYSGTSSTLSSDGSKLKSGSGAKKSDSKTTIDWIEKKLDRLQKKIDATKSKFDNLFTVKKKANNIDTQISQTEALLKATEKAAKKYKQYADKAELSKDLKKKVRDGDYNISDYSSGTADAINKYEGYYNKYKDLQKQAEELETDIRKKEEEKYRLYVDQADAKLEKSEAEAQYSFT